MLNSLIDKIEIIFPSNLPKWYIKSFLFISALVIIIGVTIYTQSVVSDLIDRETKIVEIYAGIYEKILDPNSDVNMIMLLTQDISKGITFPIIIVDENNEPNYPFDKNSLNIEIPKSYNITQQREYMKQLVAKFSENYQPIVLKHNDKVLMKFYYTHSSYIDILRYSPFFATIIIGGLILIGYVAFRNIRNSEETKVWVGMSKEAAHQLGTPLSSLLAWTEILKYSADDKETVYETVLEMEKDILRLTTIANRFSKIGSKPMLNDINLLSLVENVANYFEKRLPHLGRKVNIIVKSETLDCNIKLNFELFSWVMENLIRNAAESIETTGGIITISAHYPNDKKIQILVTDNGKGMNNTIKKQVFNPGFTTKKRGWGLGLSLSKRIVEQYHNGNMFVKETSPNKGTTFAIDLPIE